MKTCGHNLRGDGAEIRIEVIAGSACKARGRSMLKADRDFSVHDRGCAGGVRARGRRAGAKPEPTAARRRDAPAMPQGWLARSPMGPCPTPAIASARPCSSSRSRTTARSSARPMIAAGSDADLAAVNGVAPLHGRKRTAGTRSQCGCCSPEGADINAVDRLRKNAMTYAAGQGRARSSCCCSRRGGPECRVRPSTRRPDVGRRLRAERDREGAARCRRPSRSRGRSRRKTALDIAREGNFADTRQASASARALRS